MNKIFCIASLTHAAEGRGRALYATYASFYKNTDWRGELVVHLYVNGQSEELSKAIDKLDVEFSDNSKEKFFTFNVYESDVNLGCSSGVNVINDITKEYEYVLFLEGDWMCQNIDKNWLRDSLDLLINHQDIDMIYLRMFENSYKIRHHGAQWAMKGQSLQQLNTWIFRTILEPVYTNNPMLRRNKRFFDTGILPLPEVANETHDSVDWGKPELDIEHAPEGVLNAVYYRYGIFMHYDWSHMFTEDGEFINPAPLQCPWFLKCKFGFIEDKEPVFCVGCNQSQYEDIETVDEYYVHYCDTMDTKKRLAQESHKE